MVIVIVQIIARIIMIILIIIMLALPWMEEIIATPAHIGPPS